MHRDLNEGLIERLKRKTPTNARIIPPGHCLTDWHQDGITFSRDFTRCAWDVDGLEGLYATWFPVGRVHWVEAESCWRWQAFYLGGARSGLSETERDEFLIPTLAMGRVDAYLELYSLWPDELRGTKTTKYAPEPCLDPVNTGMVLVHPDGYLLSEWLRLRIHSGGSTSDRYVRVWLHSEETRLRLAPSDRTAELAQRAFPGAPHAVTLVQPARGRDWSWDLRGIRSGDHKKKDAAALQVRKALISWGASEQPRAVSMIFPDSTERVTL